MANKLRQDVSIGENLRKLRQNAGLSPEDAAAKLALMGYSISCDIISQMESGHYSVSISVLAALKQIYNVDSFDRFFDDI